VEKCYRKGNFGKGEALGVCMEERIEDEVENFKRTEILNGKRIKTTSSGKLFLIKTKTQVPQ
jgi:hypothetical protein